MVLSCMDPRFQSKVFNYLQRRKLGGKYSSFTIAGAAVGVTHLNFKNGTKTFIDNLSTSIRLHKINKLILSITKIVGPQNLLIRKEINDMNENKIHKNSFNKLKKNFKKRFPKLYCEFYLMDIKGSIKRF